MRIILWLRVLIVPRVYSNKMNIQRLNGNVESVVPKFTQYRQNVSDDGMAADGIDGIYPLEVVIPIHLPYYF